MHQLSTPTALFAAVLAAGPARPLVTFYDDATGERAELSAESAANWITKTHFLLRDELGLGVGDRALIDVPPHYLTPIVQLGAWSADLEVGTTGAAEVAFVGPHPAEDVDADEVYALALEPWGRGFTSAPPPGTLDYVAAVRPHADAWAQVRPTAADTDPALDGRNGADVVAAARDHASAQGLDATSRVLLSYATDEAADPLDFLTVLAAGASAVIVRHADHSPEHDPRRDQERITHLLD